MIGHEITLHQTNSYGCVPLCQCGWQGIVHLAYYQVHPETGRAKRRRDITEQNAAFEHGEHLRAVEGDITKRSHLALITHGRLVTAVNDSSLVHRGRFGNP